MHTYINKRGKKGKRMNYLVIVSVAAFENLDEDLRPKKSKKRYKPG